MASLEDLPQETRDELAKLARDLAENPATRKDFLRLTKKARPNLPVPQIEIEDQVRQELDAEREARTKLEARLQERDATDELSKRRRKLIDDGKAKDESEVEQIEKVMLDKKIADHETAADYWNWMQQAAKPSAPVYQQQVLDKNTRQGLAPYWKNPIAAARDEAAVALNDLRKGNVRLAAVK
jgi:hypothetical protein